ncbi:50S ribosomal protein L3 [bacterium]|nr:50S ribosomal protein L3 [bacterium]|tara:strand:+ start:234 stop:854 length:621 start_codon:yes stop_codon:yes gene_type:complete
MQFILGTKDRMTQVFDESGEAYPATILRVSPNMVTAIKTKESDGYDAVQVAAGEQKEHRSNKANIGHLGKAYQNVKEFRVRVNGDDSLENFEKGKVIDVETFAIGDTVTVSAISKGKGFQGVVKRHNFAGGPASHGQKHSLREPGSIGATGPARVFKGTKMAGRMGNDRITVKNLKVLQVNKDENLLLLKGSVPGRKGTLVEIRGN